MAKKRVTLEEIDKKLDSLMRHVKKIEKEEEHEEAEEEIIEKEEETEIKELKKLEDIEKKVAEKIAPHPLVKITYKDIAKGAVGAFIGVVAHYTFIYGIKVAEYLDVERATVLFPLAYIIGGIFLYVAGFRRVDIKLLWFLPIRLTVLYIISIIMSIAVLFLFYPDFSHNFWDAYKQVAAVTLTALVGACTADLIGKD